MSVALLDRREPVAVVTLNRPEIHNALNRELVMVLTEMLKQVACDEAITLVIFTGAGDEAFCAGADIKEMTDLEPEELHRFLADTRWLFRNLAQFEKPTIAAVNGHCHGGGAELACGCDLRIGIPSTTFRFPGAAYGMAVGTWHLPSIVGLPKAKELLYTTDTVEADEALRIGLLNRLVDDDSLLPTALEIADRITGHPPSAVRAMKSLLNGGVGQPLKQRFSSELYSNQERSVNDEVQGLFKAFLDRDRN